MNRPDQETEVLSALERHVPKAGPVKKVGEIEEGFGIDNPSRQGGGLEGELVTPREDMSSDKLELEHPELTPEFGDKAGARVMELMEDLISEGNLPGLERELDAAGFDLLELDKHGLPILGGDFRTESIDLERLKRYLEEGGFTLFDLSNAAAVTREAKKEKKVDLREGLPGTEAKEKLASGVRLDTAKITNDADRQYIEGVLATHPNVLEDLFLSDGAEKTVVTLIASNHKKPARVVIAGQIGGEDVKLSLSPNQWSLCLRAGETAVLLPAVKAKPGTELVGGGQVEPTGAEAEVIGSWQLALDSLFGGKLKSPAKVLLRRRVLVK